MSKIKQFQEHHNLVPDGIIGKKTFEKMKRVFKLNSIQLVHFLAQIHHESGAFIYDTENLKYSPKALKTVFPKYFKAEELTEFAYQPEKIANLVYSNRMGNGNESSGDGWKYRGRGGIQLTGKNNYSKFALFIGDLSILENPEVVAKDYFWESGLFYFSKNNLFRLCVNFERETIKELTRRINGGYNGLQDRINLTKYYARFV